MECESIHDIETRFTAITNELKCFGELVSLSKQVRKILRVLPKSWESKIDAITESKNLRTLTMDVRIRILQTHELNKQHDMAKWEGKKDKTLALQTFHSDDKVNGIDMAYLTRRFNKIIWKNPSFSRKGNAGRSQGIAELYHQCGKPGHYVRECPYGKAEGSKFVKDRRKDQVSQKFRMKVATDRIVMKALGYGETAAVTLMMKNSLRTHPCLLWNMMMKSLKACLHS